ncbi:uncharacterized protein LOC134194952 [Corticium candelabrum]|uniref:uncharacterized protein LOC134194952 n=1 Tax=Corticium candelabrum TaxID=121492 RepID=UPI002E27577D|nr:uncharacterized protein LOC134194952 [Corticium candelabrum]
MLSTSTWVQIFILFSMFGTSVVLSHECLSHGCNFTKEDAVPYVMTKQVGRVIKMLSTYYSIRNHTFTEKLLGNISVVMLHGSALIKAIPRQSYEDHYMSDLNATVTALREWHLVVDQFWKKLQENVTSLSNRLCSRNGKGGDGSSQESAGQTCNTIRKYWLSGRNVKSSVRWINPSQKTGAAFQIYCDFESFGGGWNLVYSSRDDSSGKNNMQKGSRSTAHITSLDPGNANKRLAYDVLKAIENSHEGYIQIMLTGYQDYQRKTTLIKMYFNNTAKYGKNFNTFIESGFAGQYGSSHSYYGTELSSLKPIALSWNTTPSFVAGAKSSGSAWLKEVWNEISNSGGHILAPEDWNNAEPHSVQTTEKGACRNRGLFHIFVR